MILILIPLEDFIMDEERVKFIMKSLTSAGLTKDEATRVVNKLSSDQDFLNLFKSDPVKALSLAGVTIQRELRQKLGRIAKEI